MSDRLARGLFLVSLAVFLATRLVGLERFPIFFLGDEAVQSVRAAALVRDGWRDEFGQLFPVQFKNGDSFNLGVTVYAYVLPALLFPRSILATRATIVLFALLATIGAALILRDFLKLSFWWLGALVLSAIPGWFLHTRIAFGLVIAAAFYVWSLFFYLRYRFGRPWSLLAAVLLAALTCYAYTGFAPVVLATAALLLACDAPFHVRHLRVVSASAAALVLLSLPYARFLRSHPEDLKARLAAYGSYAVEQAPLGRKLTQFARGYADALSPGYWFDPESRRDLVRHRMKGYGQIPWLAVPFAAVGLGLCAARIRDPARRALVVALIAAPCGAALVGPGITRELTFVIVFAMLATVALDALLVALERSVPARSLAVGVFLLLTAGQAAMLADALAHGPTWYRDYGLYGMEWGARDLDRAILNGLARSANTSFFVTPDFANGSDVLVLFFFPGEKRVEIRHLDHYKSHWRELDEKDVHVLTPAEYEAVRRGDRFLVAQVDSVLRTPDGAPGLYLVHLRNPPEIERRMAEEAAARRRLVTEPAASRGSPVLVRHSRIVAGRVADLFDGRPDTLVQFDELNPAIVEIELEKPRPVALVRVTTAALTDVAIGVELFSDVAAPATRCEREFRHVRPDPTLEIPCGAASRDVRRVRIEVRDLDSRDTAYIHLREIELR